MQFWGIEEEDVFIVNMNKRKAENELCRSKKTSEEVYLYLISDETNTKKRTYRQPGERHCAANPLEHSRSKRNQLERSEAVIGKPDNADGDSTLGDLNPKGLTQL